jgi:hypothetical protein
MISPVPRPVCVCLVVHAVPPSFCRGRMYHPMSSSREIAQARAATSILVLAVCFAWEATPSLGRRYRSYVHAVPEVHAIHLTGQFCRSYGTFPVPLLYGAVP